MAVDKFVDLRLEEEFLEAFQISRYTQAFLSSLRSDVVQKVDDFRQISIRNTFFFLKCEGWWWFRVCLKNYLLIDTHGSIMQGENIQPFHVG